MKAVVVVRVDQQTAAWRLALTLGPVERVEVGENEVLFLGQVVALLRLDRSVRVAFAAVLVSHERQASHRNKIQRQETQKQVNPLARHAGKGDLER